MNEDFWQRRWNNNQIGFHQGEANLYLRRHWPSLGLQQGARVLVPLCGKSLDMDWLLEQGYQVLGIELIEQAVKDFYTEHELQPEIVQHGAFRIYRAGSLEIWCGDFFALSPEDVAECSAFYDRAALIALPPDMRSRYAGFLETLLPDFCKGLLITLDYAQGEMKGPPFAVDHEEVLDRFGKAWDVQLLESVDVLGENWTFVEQGLSALHERAYYVAKRR